MYLFAPVAVVVPLTIATAVGAATIVGERERGTGEFLAHSPAGVHEIYLGKLLASLLPGYVTTIVGFGVYSLLVNTIVGPEVGGWFFPTRAWWVLMFWVVPPFLALTLSLVLRLSARVKSTAAAQQASGLVSLPLIMIAYSQSTGALYGAESVAWIIGGARVGRGHRRSATRDARRDPRAAARCRRRSLKEGSDDLHARTARRRARSPRPGDPRGVQAGRCARLERAHADQRHRSGTDPRPARTERRTVDPAAARWMQAGTATAARVRARGYAPPGYAGPAKTEGLAVASLILGVLGWIALGIGSIIAIVLGFRAISNIDRSGARLQGKGLAVAGIVLGFLGVAAIGLGMVALVLGEETGSDTDGRVTAEQLDAAMTLKVGDCFDQPQFSQHRDRGCRGRPPGVRCSLTTPRSTRVTELHGGGRRAVPR